MINPVLERIAQRANEDYATVTDVRAAYAKGKLSLPDFEDLVATAVALEDEDE